MPKSIEVPASKLAKLPPPGGSLKMKKMRVGSDATGMKFGISLAITPTTGMYHVADTTEGPSIPFLVPITVRGKANGNTGYGLLICITYVTATGLSVALLGARGLITRVAL